MNGRVLWTLWLVAASVAGCLTPGAKESGGPQPATMPVALALDSCHEQIGTFPVADEDVRGMLPDGFDPLPPLPPDVYPDADPTGQSATLLYVAFFCDEPAGTAFVVPWVPVVPPAPMRQDGVTYHAVAPTILTGSPETAAWFESADLPATFTTISQQITAPAAFVGSATEVTASGGGISLSLVGASPRSEAPTPEEWLRIFLVEDRTVIGILDLHISEHIHWQFGSARVSASGPGMLSPSQPGLSTHSAPGLAMTLATVSLADAGRV